MNRFSWTPMRCARVCGIIFTGSAFLFLFLTLSCPELKFEYSSCSKSNTPCCRDKYHPGRTFFFTHLHTENCFDLVCTAADQRQMFLSPCHYGCTNQTLDENNTILYSSCNCANDSTVILAEAACQFRRIPCKRLIT